MTRVHRAYLIAATTLAACAQPALAAPLTAAEVKTVIEAIFPAKYVWRSVQIAAPRRASPGESRAAGLPPAAVITPVRVDYTRIVGDGGRDFKWNYYFYKDDFGGWTAQSNATPGNVESDLYYVKP